MDFAIRRLVHIQYQRNNLAARGVPGPGDTLEIHPAYEETVLHIEWWGDDIERITRLDPVTGEVVQELTDVTVYPATHYVAAATACSGPSRASRRSSPSAWRSSTRPGKLLEAQRLRMRTTYDLEMMREMGFCSGIENYSRHIDGREAGTAPYTLLDYFPEDWLCVIDESHVTVPHLHGMYEGDMSAKGPWSTTGSGSPQRWTTGRSSSRSSARVQQVVYMSATPGPYELRVSKQVVEQVVRPTGLMDPEVQIRPTRGQVDDLMEEIRKRAEADERVLVTTLTKKMAEDLTDYLIEMGIRVRYLHREVDTVQRIEIIRDLRLGEFDVLVGINLLREGLDLPEVSLVAILDADKEGFLRSETSLIQTIGRAARNVSGTVIMYADEVTDSMRSAISETQRRRMIQEEYNREHGIDPQSIRKEVTDILLQIEGVGGRGGRQTTPEQRRRKREHPEMPTEELQRLIQTLEEEMHQAAKDLRFEYAARIRDEVKDLRKELKALRGAGVSLRHPDVAEGQGPGRVVRAGCARPPRGRRLRGRARRLRGSQRGRASRSDELLEVDGFLMLGRAHRHVHIRLADPGAVLLGGVTAVRDLAWVPDEIFELSSASELPTFTGPVIRAAGPMLTAPGGYPTASSLGPARDRAASSPAPRTPRRSSGSSPTRAPPRSRSR